VVGDLASLAETRAVAEAAAMGTYDAVIHNAGLDGADDRMVTDDGFERIFQVNVLVPYVTYLLHPSACSADLPRVWPGAAGRGAPRRPPV
jgi:NAD(P)-dependent dehydrogenase (short-subunit alcohol dehydrogenase family)